MALPTKAIARQLGQKAGSASKGSFEKTASARGLFSLPPLAGAFQLLDPIGELASNPYGVGGDERRQRPHGGSRAQPGPPSPTGWLGLRSRAAPPSQPAWGLGGLWAGRLQGGPAPRSHTSLSKYGAEDVILPKILLNGSMVYSLLKLNLV